MESWLHDNLDVVTNAPFQLLVQWTYGVYIYIYLNTYTRTPNYCSYSYIIISIYIYIVSQRHIYILHTSVGVDESSQVWRDCKNKLLVLISNIQEQLGWSKAYYCWRNHDVWSLGNQDKLPKKQQVQDFWTINIRILTDQQRSDSTVFIFHRPTKWLDWRRSAFPCNAGWKNRWGGGTQIDW